MSLRLGFAALRLLALRLLVQPRVGPWIGYAGLLLLALRIDFAGPPLLVLRIDFAGPPSGAALLPLALRAWTAAHCDASGAVAIGC